MVRVDLDAETCSGSEAGSYLRRIDFMCHFTRGLRVTKKKKKNRYTIYNIVLHKPLKVILFNAWCRVYGFGF